MSFDTKALKKMQKNFLSECQYIISALHINGDNLSAPSIDEIIRNICDELKPFMPSIEQDGIYLESYLRFSIKQQAVIGAYLRLRKLIFDIQLGTKEILFLGNLEFEKLMKHINEAKEDPDLRMICSEVQLYGKKTLSYTTPPQTSALANYDSQKINSAINAFRNQLHKIKKETSYSQHFLDINSNESHYNFPVYSSNLVYFLTTPLKKFETKLRKLNTIGTFDTNSEEQQLILLNCYRAHQELASYFKLFETELTVPENVNDVLSFNYMLESFYHIDYLQKALELRKENRKEDYIFRTMLDNMLIANAELPNAFFRHTLVKKEIEYYKESTFYKEKYSNEKTPLVSIYPEENLKLSSLETTLFWSKRTTDLPKIMNRLIYPAAELLLCHSLAPDNNYEQAYETLKTYMHTNGFLYGIDIDFLIFREKNNSSNTPKIQHLPSTFINSLTLQSFDENCTTQEGKSIFNSLFSNLDAKEKKELFFNKYNHVIQSIIKHKETLSYKADEFSEADFTFLYQFYKTLFSPERAEIKKDVYVSDNIRHAIKSDTSSTNARNTWEHYRNTVAEATKNLITS